jgi:hypothetical protein
LCDSVETAAEALRIDVVNEGALAVDLDDWKPLAITRLQIGVAGDVDLAEGEVELGLERAQDRARPLAEVALLRVIQDYVTDKGLGSSSLQTLAGPRAHKRRCAC